MRTVSSRIALDVRMLGHSGIGSYLRGLTAELACLSPSPRLALLGPRGLARRIAEHGALWEWAAFDAEPYGIPGQAFPPRWRREWVLFHAPHYTLPLRWPRERALAVTIHDLIHLESPSPLKRAYLRFFLGRLQQRDTERLRVIVGSQATRERLLAAVPRLDRAVVRLVPYGIAREFFAPPPAPDEAAEWRKRRGLPSHYLLMVGIALPHKNHEFVLRALAPLYKAKRLETPLVIAGVGEEGARRYRRLAADVAPGAPITVVPRLLQGEMPLLYAGAAALVFPSLVEGYGLPIVEAQAVGTPVAASDRPAPREAAGDAAIYFDPTDAESLRAAVERALGDEELRRRLAALGRARTAEMTWARTARMTAEVYRELAGDAVFEAVERSRPGAGAKPKTPAAAAETPPVPFAGGRVAFVHDWLNGRRGGERVLEDLLDLWPLAGIHTLFYEPHRVSDAINRRAVFPSVLQRLPRTRRYYRYLLPLYPWAMRRMDLSGCDLVISISHCAAKAAPAPPGVPHVCYCLTPARYLYDQAAAYFGGESAWRARLRSAALERLRRWDQETAGDVTHFIAISNFVAERIRRAYGRAADVVYPAVDTEFFTPPDSAAAPREDFFLTVSTAVPYKRLDLAVEAFNETGWPLVVVGRGPDLGRLRRMARPNVRFVPWVGRTELRDLCRRARAFVFAAEEDFGIAPVEAQACGCPVVAFGRGGAAETVRHGVTGLLFAEQSKGALLDALRAFRPADFSPAAIRANAERFNPQRFRREFVETLRRVLKTS